MLFNGLNLLCLSPFNKKKSRYKDISILKKITEIMVVKFIIRARE
jgi:hypothetical protein